MEPPSAAGARCEEANLPGVGQGVRTAVTQKGLPEGVVSLTGKETTLGLQRPQGAGPLSASQEGRRGCGPGPILGLLLVAAGTPFPLCTRRDEAHLQLHRLYCPGLPQTQGEFVPGTATTPRTETPPRGTPPGPTVLCGTVPQVLLFQGANPGVPRATPTSQGSQAVPQPALRCTLLPQRGPLPCSAQPWHSLTPAHAPPTLCTGGGPAQPPPKHTPCLVHLQNQTCCTRHFPQTAWLLQEPPQVGDCSPW